MPTSTTPRRARIGSLLLLLPFFALTASAAGCASDGAGNDEIVADSDDLGEDTAALSTGMLDSEEVAFLSQLNSYRAGLGLRKVHVSIALTHAADAHSADMASTGVLTHDSSDGTDVFTRIKKYYGYNTAVGEICADGTTTGAGAFAAWRASPEHDAIMRGSGYAVVGISRVAASDGTMFWTADFGGYVDAILSAGFGTIAANGSFETNAFGSATFSSIRTLNEWFLRAGTGGGVARTTDHVSGTYGLRVHDVDGSSASAAEVVRAAPGINYRVVASARLVAGTSQQHVYLDFLDGSWARIQALPVSSGTSAAWAPVQSEGVAPAGTRYVRVILWGSGAAGQASTYDYDAVKILAW